MILIGITGAIGHGKTSLAEAFLVHEPTGIHDESSQLISEFANDAKIDLPKSKNISEINVWLDSLQEPIRKHLHAIVHTSDLHITDDIDLSSSEYVKLHSYILQTQKNPKLLTEQITAATKANHRAILQWFGGYFVKRLSSTIWYDELIRRAKTANQNGCKLYVIGGLRFPGDADSIHNAGGLVVEIVRPDKQTLDTNDPTERERSKIRCDSRILNNGSLEDLKIISSDILADIQNNTLEKEYRGAHS